MLISKETSASTQPGAVVCKILQQYDVKIFTNSTFENMIVTFVGDLNEIVDDTCEQDGVDQSCCVLDGNSSACIPLRKDVGEPKCNLFFKEAFCTFYNVKPGNYCIRIMIDDERCLPDTVWTSSNPCRWSLTLVVERQSPDMAFVSIFSSIGIVISAVVIISGVLIIVGLWFLLFKNKSSNWDPAFIESFQEEDSSPMMIKLKVLLLYPRDCDQFMTVMDSFRRVLEKFNQIEVIDCYKNEEVWNGSSAWLQALMSEPQLCTIIVMSHCGYMQQKALISGHLSNNYSIYKEPTFLDAVFIYGLKLIMENISPDIYQKNYVIGFDGFMEKMSVLTLPTSFRRYIIPDHFQKLLSDMSVVCEENSYVVELSDLRNSIKNLVKYQSENPQYLDDMLHLT